MKLSAEKKFTVKEMIGKSAFTTDEIVIGKITKIIDQKDTEDDDECYLGDIKTDLFQIVVEINPEKFTTLSEPTEVLFSSQTIDNVSESGFKLLLTKETIDSYIAQGIK